MAVMTRGLAKLGYSLRIRCPHCHDAVELVDNTRLSDIAYDSCGSHFNLIEDRQETRTTTVFYAMGVATASPDQEPRCRRDLHLAKARRWPRR